MPKINDKKILNYSLVGLLFLIIIVYSILQTRNLFNGAKISVLNIENGQTFTNPLLTLSGSAKNAKSFSIDDRSVNLDTKGNFSEPLLLAPGRNIISLKAVNRFVESEEKIYQVYYKNK